MSRSNPVPARISVPRRLTLQAAGCLAAVASSVLRRAARRAHRELMTLDDRTLADIDLLRTELAPLLEVLAGVSPTALAAQFPRNRPRIQA